MAALFRMPDLGEGLREAEIVAWHVGVGDHVVRDQPLCSVETDKAVVELPSPHAGKIAALHGEPGEVVHVGAPLVQFSSAANIGDVDDSGNVLDLARDQPPASSSTRVRRKIAPAVRQLAHERGVDIENIAGTGPQGVITKADIEATAAATPLSGERIRGVRRAMMRKMAHAGREVVIATVTDEANIDSWSELSDATVRLIRAMVAGCRAAPSLNAWFDADAQTLTLHENIDLGVAVETEDGLFAPVIRGVGSRDADDLRQALDAGKSDIVDRSAAPAAFENATITLSNFGMFGGRFASLVVVPPQVAILGAGRAQVRVIAVEARPVLRRMMPLSLSFDHRVVTGIEATRFLNAVIEDLEKPE